MSNNVNKDTLNISFDHFIFFATLNETHPEIGTNFKTYIGSGLPGFLNNKIKKIIQTNESLQYMGDFLATIQKMALQERKNEEEYLRSLKKTHGNKTSVSYITNGHFDYMKFIEDLNNEKLGEDEYKQTLFTARDQFTKLEKKAVTPKKESIKKVKNYNIWEMYLPKSQRKAQEIEVKVTQENYEKYYSEGSVKIANAIKAAMLENSNIQTYNQQISTMIHNKLQELRNNSKLIQVLQPYLNPKSQISKAKLQAAIIAILRTSFNNEAILTNKAKMSSILKKTIDSNFDNFSFLSGTATWEEQLMNFIENATQEYTQGLFDAYETLMKNLPELEKKTFKDSELGKEIEETYKATIANIKANKDKTAQAKRDFAKKIKQIMHKKEQKIRANNKNRRKKLTSDQIVHTIISEDLKITNLNSVLSEIFNITNFSRSDMAELSGAIRELVLKNIDQTNTGGKVIKLRNDFSFSYIIKPLPLKFIENSLNKKQQKIYMTIKKQLASIGEEFSKEYHKDTENDTANVELAYEKYLMVITKVAKSIRDFLNTITDKNVRKKYEQEFDAILSSVSVKEYGIAYDLEKGYHAGSLGQNDLVEPVVKNLIKMMDYGGIDGADVNKIVTALLNSFSGSIIGLDYKDDILNFLLVGAAMTLFDDGFTSGKKFLEQINKQINDDEPTKGGTSGLIGNKTMHLLLLNNLYYPQSYILQNIYEHLLKEYNQLIGNSNNPEQLLTNLNIKQTLMLNNPMTADMEFTVMEQTGVVTRQDAWERVRDIAENSVTLNYAFMGGMLDIVKSLASAFD